MCVWRDGVAGLGGAIGLGGGGGAIGLGGGGGGYGLEMNLAQGGVMGSADGFG